jgi:hypothetical protein
MSFVLLMIGLLAAAIGAIMVGFGIPINEFSLGNTLIIAGTTALMGGLIVIGLALALRQLANLVAALNARPVAQTPVAARTAAEAVDQPAPLRSGARIPMSVPARPEPPQPRAPRAHEPRIGIDSPLADTADASPRALARPVPPSDDALEMPSWRPPRAAPEPSARKEAPRVAPPERRSAETAYDAIWPPEGRGTAASDRGESAAPEPRALGGESGAGDAPSTRPEPVSVLKSGVVDGMAYTLYTDGSIEAELAQGVVRFGSIEELRNHLEKSAS